MSLELGFLSFLFERNMWWVFPFTFLVGVISFSLLIVAGGSRFKFVRSLFYIPARKSISNAVQLGGLPLSLTIILGITQAFSHQSFGSFFSVLDHYTIKYWFIGAGVIVMYGYFDDRFELRPIIKLILQVFSVCSFAMLESRVLFPKWGALAFLVLSFVGLGVVNGSNLLDGLDTLTIKLGAVTFGAFLVISANFKVGSIAVISLICMSAIGAFYLFNKEPAKIHLGEIGGSFVGFSSLLLSCLTYTSLSRMKYDELNSFAMATLPLLLPMTELSISFLRRIYNRKSPFKGDKYHIHHILRNYHDFSPSNASSLFALGHAGCLTLGFATTHFFGPIIGLLIAALSYTTSYILVGKKYWNGKDSYDLKPANLFDFLLKKDVSVINSLEVDDFEIKIIGHEEEDQDRAA